MPWPCGQPAIRLSLGDFDLERYTDIVSIMAEDILRRVEETLGKEGGSRIVHDFVERLAGEMENMSREECALRAELLGGLSETLAITVPETVVTGEGAEALSERLKTAGWKGSVADSPPREAEAIWRRLSPRVFDLRKRLNGVVLYSTEFMWNFKRAAR